MECSSPVDCYTIKVQHWAITPWAAGIQVLKKLPGRQGVKVTLEHQVAENIVYNKAKQETFNLFRNGVAMIAVPGISEAHAWGLMDRHLRIERLVFPSRKGDHSYYCRIS